MGTAVLVIATAGVILLVVGKRVRKPSDADVSTFTPSLLGTAAIGIALLLAAGYGLYRLYV